MTDMADMAGLVAASSVLVCCGPGGVGKTTLAAAAGVEAASRGRKVVVVTIDPARRLADAMGLSSLPDQPHPIPGDWPGELWALMLDPRSTFDGLVTRYSPDQAQAESILANRFYRNIAGALSGTQEYMAMEKLYELHGDERFDLVVVDTPPTRNALDFVDAPRRLTRFLDNRLFRLLLLPTRASIRALNLAAQTFLRTVSRVVGSDVVTEAVAFFQAFEGMEEGFRQRAQLVGELLRDSRTAFVLVTTPRRDAAVEADYFADRLTETGIAVRALVVNRAHPRFELAGEPGPALEEVAAGTPLEPFVSNLHQLALVADAEDAQVAGLVERISPAPTVRVALLEADVCDLAGLSRIAAYVFAR